jgi:hypothetical protein
MDDRRMLQLGPMGEDGPVGAIHLITDKKRREAAGLVREGCPTQ